MKLNMFTIGILVLASCGAEIPVKSPAQATSARTGTAVDPKSNTGVGGTATSVATSAVTGQTGTTSATQILRHLPGTAVKLAGAATVYLVMDDATLAPFGSATALHTSGYADAMVVAITAAEFSCYGSGKTIKSGLPAPAAGHLRDGTLVKEDNKSTVYAVSDGIGWSIVSMDVFTAAGYKTASVEVVSAGTIKNIVDEIGSCAAGIACLDADYMSTCAKDEVGDVIIDPPPVDDTGTQTAVATSVATSAPTSTHTAEATSVATSAPTSATTSATTSVGTGTSSQTQGTASTHTAANTQTATQTQGAAQNPAQQTNTVTAVSTATQTTAPVATSVSVTVTATQTAAQTSVAASATQTATGTQTTVSVASAASATSTSTQTATQTISAGTAATMPETWVWVGDGAMICLNAAYFMPHSATRAVLRTWTGPYVTGTNGGPVTGKDGQNRFCWDFAGMPAGIYRLWADVPAISCANTDFCGDDGISGDGAQYGTAPNATAGEHKWLYCLDTGCDGYAVFNGTAWLPANL